MPTIHKYPLAQAPETTLMLPPKSKILTVDIHGPSLRVWVLHDPGYSGDLEGQRFWVLHDEQDAMRLDLPPEGLKYLGGAFDEDMQVQYHVFHAPVAHWLERRSDKPEAG